MRVHAGSAGVILRACAVLANLAISAMHKVSAGILSLPLPSTELWTLQTVADVWTVLHSRLQASIKAKGAVALIKAGLAAHAGNAGIKAQAQRALDNLK